MTLFGIVTEIKPEEENAFLAIDVTLPGMVIEAKLLQPENVFAAISVRLFGSLTEAKPELEKAELPILVTGNFITL